VSVTGTECWSVPLVAVIRQVVNARWSSLVAISRHTGRSITRHSHDIPREALTVSDG
jgi:hypothetical protein